MDHEDRSPFLLKNMSKHLQFIEKIRIFATSTQTNLCR